MTHYLVTIEQADGEVNIGGGVSEKYVDTKINELNNKIDTKTTMDEVKDVLSDQYTSKLTFDSTLSGYTTTNDLKENILTNYAKTIITDNINNTLTSSTSISPGHKHTISDITDYAEQDLSAVITKNTEQDTRLDTLETTTIPSITQDISNLQQADTVLHQESVNYYDYSREHIEEIEYTTIPTIHESINNIDDKLSIKIIPQINSLNSITSTHTSKIADIEIKNEEQDQRLDEIIKTAEIYIEDKTLSLQIDCEKNSDQLYPLVDEYNIQLNPVSEDIHLKINTVSSLYLTLYWMKIETQSSATENIYISYNGNNVTVTGEGVSQPTFNLSTNTLTISRPSTYRLQNFVYPELNPLFVYHRKYLSVDFNNPPKYRINNIYIGDSYLQYDSSYKYSQSKTLSLNIDGIDGDGNSITTSIDLTNKGNIYLKGKTVTNDDVNVNGNIQCDTIQGMYFNTDTSPTKTPFIPVVKGSAVMEVGRIIDFHSYVADGEISGTDYDCRLYWNNDKLTCSKTFTAPNISSSFTVTHETGSSDTTLTPGTYCETDGTIYEQFKDNIKVDDCICNIKQSTTLNKNIIGVTVSTDPIKFATHGDVLIKVVNDTYNVGDILVPGQGGYGKKPTSDELMTCLLNKIPTAKITSLETGIDNEVACIML